MKSLESLNQGTPAEVLLEAALALNIASIKEVILRSRLEAVNAQAALQELLDAGSLMALEEGPADIAGDLLVIPRSQWNVLQEKILQTIESYHIQYPLRRGIPREELKSRLKLSPRAFNDVLNKLITDHFLSDHSTLVAKPEHEVRFDRDQEAKVQSLMRKFEQNPYGPPGVKELQAEVNEEIQNALIESGQLVAVSNDVLFRKQDYDFMVNKIKEEIKHKGRITLGEVRDLFNTSRKYAQALLEYLDAVGVTVRVGDFRTLKSK